MGKYAIIAARQLVDYITEKTDLLLINPNDCPYSDHIGALFTDVILQSGVNYKTVVVPRVSFVLRTYPQAISVKRFYRIIEIHGAENVLKWKDDVKRRRMLDLLEFCLCNRLNIAKEIKVFLLSPKNQREFLRINGIGNKTLDYLLKLLNIETIAVDRHIYSFVEKAGIESNDYNFVKAVVEYAADIMEVSRRTMDYSIWSYMSNLPKNKQLSINY